VVALDISPKRDAIVSQIRLAALLYVASRLGTLQELPVAFEGDAVEGSWFVSQGAEGHFVFCWNRRGVVALRYSKLDDFDGQGPLDERERTPDIYLRHPHRSVLGGVPVPSWLEPLAVVAENHPHIHRLASQGLWVSEDAASLAALDASELGPLYGYLVGPGQAMYGGTGEDGTPRQGWAAELGLYPEQAELALMWVGRDWGHPATLSPEDERALLTPFRYGLAYDASRLQSLARLLRKLGVAWEPPGLPPGPTS